MAERNAKLLKHNYYGGGKGRSDGQREIEMDCKSEIALLFHSTTIVKE